MQQGGKDAYIDGCDIQSFKCKKIQQQAKLRFNLKEKKTDSSTMIKLLKQASQIWQPGERTCSVGKGATQNCKMHKT